MRLGSIASVAALSAALAFGGIGSAAAFGGRHGGVGHGGYGFGAAGLDDGFYGQDYYAGNYDYDAGQYGYGYQPGYGYDQSGFGAGLQYSEAPEDPPVRTGRSAATLGDSCATPVKVCTLYNQSYVGGGCSCKVSGGRSRGHVTP